MFIFYRIHFSPMISNANYGQYPQIGFVCPEDNEELVTLISSLYPTDNYTNEVNLKPINNLNSIRISLISVIRLTAYILFAKAYKMDNSRNDLLDRMIQIETDSGLGRQDLIQRALDFYSRGDAISWIEDCESLLDDYKASNVNARISFS